MCKRCGVPWLEAPERGCGPTTHQTGSAGSLEPGRAARRGGPARLGEGGVIARRMVLRVVTLLSCVVVVACGCSKKETQVEKGSAPPPIASSKPGVCNSGGGNVADATSASYFPRVASGYCIDPNGETRSYGEAAKGTLETVCTELLDGECEVYKGFGLKRVVTLRYVDGAGSPATV